MRDDRPIVRIKTLVVASGLRQATRAPRVVRSRPNVRPADIVAAIGGAHAQVLSAAELSIALRGLDLTRTDIRDALWSERTLVKTFGPRGTVHLLATRDLPVWTAALSAIPHAPSGVPLDARLTREQTETVVEAIGMAVAGVTLTIDELNKSILSRTGTWAGDPVTPGFQGMWPRWRQALGIAGKRGVVCFEPDQGRNVTYASPQRWLPGIQPADPHRCSHRDRAPLLAHLRPRHSPAIRAVAGGTPTLGDPAIRLAL